MINWDNWQTLLAVYRSGSYSQAAKSLRIDATTVGRRIKTLEKLLAYPLFVRNEGRLYPSNRCESLLAHVETASEALRLAEQESVISDNGLVWRELRLAAPPFIIKNVLTQHIDKFTESQRVRIELIAKINNASLSKRETDITISIDDKLSDNILKIELIESEIIGEVAYAVYAKSDLNSEDLPWAGLREGHVRTSGSEVMLKLAGNLGFRYRTHSFDSLCEIVSSGVAKAMLPRIVADNESRLKAVSETVLSQPLRMLYHSQDSDVHHLKDARNWIKSLV